MSNNRLVYMNGEFVLDSEAKISIYDSALMFGDMVFEMTRSFNKQQFKLRDHLTRLYTGLKILRIPIQMSIEEIKDIIQELPPKLSSGFDNLSCKLTKAIKDCVAEPLMIILNKSVTEGNFPKSLKIGKYFSRYSSWEDRDSCNSSRGNNKKFK